jgi:hypothetical protein
MTVLFRFLGYISTKWICFYLYQYLESGSSLKWERLETKEDFYYTVWMLFILPIIEIFLLVLPIHLAIRQKGWLMVTILVLTFMLEFAIGWYATNQQFSVWMIIKIALSVGFFYLFYRKKIIF